MHAAASSGGNPGGPLLDDLDIARHRLVGANHLIARCIEGKVRGIDDDVGIEQFAELTQFLRREGRLSRTPTSEEVNIGDRRRPECVEHMLRHVRLIELANSLGEHPCHVDCDIAHADHGNGGGRRDEPLIRGAIGIRVPAVPGDEVGRGDAAVEVLPLDLESAVTRRAIREDHCIEVLVELSERDVHPHLEVADESDPGLVENLVEGVANRSDAQVVRGHPISDEPERHGQAVDDVDGHVEVGLARKRVCRIHAGWTRTDHRDAQRTRHSSLLKSWVTQTGRKSNALLHVASGGGARRPQSRQPLACVSPIRPAQPPRNANAIRPDHDARGAHHRAEARSHPTADRCHRRVARRRPGEDPSGHLRGERGFMGHRRRTSLIQTPNSLRHLAQIPGELNNNRSYDW